MALEKDQKAGARAVLAGNAVQSPPKEAPAVEEPAKFDPAKFDPAVILGTSSDVMAYTYAMAAAKLIQVGPLQTATRVKAVRCLMLALEFLK